MGYIYHYGIHLPYQLVQDFVHLQWCIGSVNGVETTDDFKAHMLAWHHTSNCLLSSKISVCYSWQYFRVSSEHRIYIWVFPKIGKHPKMDGENNGKPGKPY